MQELEARFTAPNACLANLLCDAHDLDRAAFTVVNEDVSFAQMTYGELPERSERVAAGLAAFGVSTGDTVATLMSKSPEYLATVVGILRLGAAHLPPFTAFAPPAIAMRLEGSRAKVVVTDSSQRAKLGGGSGETPSSQVVHFRCTGAALVPGDDDLISKSHATVPAVTVGGHGTMTRMYTWGTTGRPQGVAPVAAMATWQLYLDFGLHVTDDDIFWCVADPGWAYGLFSAVLAPMAAGRTSILQVDKFSAEASWRILHDLNVTNVTAARNPYSESTYTTTTGRQNSEWWFATITTRSCSDHSSPAR